MRLSELNLLRYGRFEDRRLPFHRNGGPDLQVVYGPNEAGKSTTMSAVSDFLFGFGRTTPFAFRFDQKLLQVGAVLEADGGTMTLRRRKGNARTLLDDKGEPVPEAPLAALLGGQDADTFHRMFSLDHARLRQGGQAILDAKDDIGRAIFAAGSGLVRVTELLQELEDEAKQIWTRRAGADRAYHAAHRAWEEARTRQKASQVRPGEWDRLRKANLELDQQLERLHASLREKEGARRKIERHRRVLGPARKRALILEELDKLGEVPSLPGNAADRLTAAERELARLEQERRVAQAQADAASASLAALHVDEKTLELAPGIEVLRESRGAVEKGLGDLPRRKTEAQTLGRRLGELLQEMGWAVQEPAVVRARLPGRVAVAAARELLSELRNTASLAESARAELDQARRDAATLERDGVRLEPPPDTRALEAALKFAASRGDVDLARDQAARQLNQGRKALEASLARLAPWSGSAEDLDRLAVPSADAASVLAVRMSGAERELDQARQALAQRQADAKRHELEREQSLRAGQAVPPEAVERSRSLRDEAWTSLRAYVKGHGPAPSNPGLEVAEYETLVADADALADRRFAAAEHSARLAAVADELQRLELEIESDKRTVGVAERAVEEAAAAWAAKLGPAGIRLAAADFPGWLERKDAALAAAARVRELEGALEEVEQHRARARETLGAALTSMGEAVSPDLPTGAMLQLAETRVKSAASTAKARAALDGKLAANGQAIERAAARVQKAEEKEAQARERAGPALAHLGLGPEPDGTVAARLDIVDEMRGLTESIVSLRHRVKAIEDDAAEFARKIVALASDCGLPPGTPEAQLSALLARAAGARAQDGKRRTLQAQLDEASGKARGASAALAATRESLAPLLNAAGASDLDELHAVLDRAERLRAKQVELSEAEADILSGGDGAEVEALVAEVQDIDPHELRAESDRLQGELAGLGRDIEAATAERATARSEFEALDSGPSAALAAADAAHAAAEMEAQAHAYMRVRTEASLLSWAIERYRREKQGPLLRRASELFSLLTLGRYSSLMVDADGDRARLSGLATDGEKLVPVEGMSEGTVDQLYLSLRLAAIEEALANGPRLPFLADDLFINYDDDRARAGFRILAELATRTQVLFFTHHEHLVAIAEEVVPGLKESTCRLLH
jgi:uncharacterized protein YhaN